MPVECEAHAQVTRRVGNGREAIDVLGASVLPTRLGLSDIFPVPQLCSIHSVVLLNDH